MTIQPTLRPGDAGARVRALQERLTALGFPIATVEVAASIFGGSTTAKVKDFQARLGLAADGIVGPLTAAKLNATAPAPAAASGLPPWLENARRLIGTKEIAGRVHNDVIMSFPRKIATRHPALAWAIAIFTGDETPWCGAFVAYCVSEAGISPDRSYPSALAWADWGQALSGPAVGAICVKTRKRGGHVGFVAGRTASGHLAVLGGNQGNAAKISPYNPNAFSHYRWPPGVPLPPADKIGFRNLPLVSSSGRMGESEA